MACYHPISAWRNTYSDLRLKKRSGPFFKPPPSVAISRGTVKFNPLPCGRCIGCRIEYSRQWAVRGIHEAQMHERNCFLTLTYDPKHLPSNLSLDKSHYQLFLKRLRRAGYKFNYMFAGEYGDRLKRPHYHAIIFGEDFKKGSVVAPCSQSAEMPLYTNPDVARIWGKGFITIANCTFASIQYVASYITKKVNGELAKDHYGDRIPEFMQPSLKSPIGKSWFLKFGSDVFPSDEVIFDGKSLRPPRYYARLYERQDAMKALDIKVKREVFAEANNSKLTPDRLADMKLVTLSRFKDYVKDIE